MQAHQVDCKCSYANRLIHLCRRTILPFFMAKTDLMPHSRTGLLSLHHPCCLLVGRSHSRCLPQTDGVALTPTLIPPPSTCPENPLISQSRSNLAGYSPVRSLGEGAFGKVQLWKAADGHQVPPAPWPPPKAPMTSPTGRSRSSGAKHCIALWL